MCLLMNRDLQWSCLLVNEILHHYLVWIISQLCRIFAFVRVCKRSPFGLIVGKSVIILPLFCLVVGFVFCWLLSFCLELCYGDQTLFKEFVVWELEMHVSCTRTLTYCTNFDTCTLSTCALFRAAFSLHSLVSTGDWVMTVRDWWSLPLFCLG